MDRKHHRITGHKKQETLTTIMVGRMIVFSFGLKKDERSVVKEGDRRAGEEIHPDQLCL